jgi:putative CocE/NonD family hydrolase
MKSRLQKSLILIAIFILGSAHSIRAQAVPSPQPTELAKHIRENYTKREVAIPMRDGVKLYTSIYEPKDQSQKYPILLNRTPYSIAPYGADKFPGSLGPSEPFAREGYIFVYQDVRGRMMSEGEFVEIRPAIKNKTGKQIDESSDTYDTIDWLIKNIENNNGRVGTYGISYPGFYTSAGSIDSHPALKACSPQAPVSDWFHGDDTHHNGALFLAQEFSFYGFFGQTRPGPTNNNSHIKPFRLGTQDGYNFFLNLGGVKEAGDFYEKQLGYRIKFWDEPVSHPNYDEYWKERNILPNLKNVKCATMTVGGWYDNEDLYGALQTYQHIERQNPGIFNVLVMGPWFHGGWARGTGEWLGTAYFGSKTSQEYRDRLEVPFFNYFLKDKGDIANIKEVNAFDTGANQWREFTAYNPTNTTATPLYLEKGGKLSFVQPKTESGFDEYVSDPMKPVPYTQKITINYPRDYMTEDQRFAATRPDVLVYQTDPLTEDITVAGDITPQLFVSSSGTDSDFVVKLIDVFPSDYQYPNGVRPPETFQPGGYQMLLRGEPMPARFRKSFERPEPLQPNTPTALGNFVMPGITHTFKKGHRIMVQIQSTWFPLVARNPQKFMPNYKLGTASDFQKATERIYYGATHQSLITLPVLKP